MDSEPRVRIGGSERAPIPGGLGTPDGTALLAALRSQ
jgi:hypothetical protein